MVLPDLEHQRNIEELSRLVLGVHEEVQREAEQQAKDAPATVRGAAEGACGGGGGGSGGGAASAAEGVEADHGAGSDSCQPGPSTTTSPPEAQPFVLPLGVMARNEVYPRTCRKW